MNRLDTENLPFTNNPRAEDAVVEIAVLLESQLLTSLEEAACAQNISAAALVRCLLRDFLCYSDNAASPRESREVREQHRYGEYRCSAP